jgi:hypothetical protein
VVAARERPTRAWLIAGGAPGPAERGLALREPLRLATVDAILWVAGAIGFAALNAPTSGALALQVGGTVLLGGLATCALIYLLAERVERPVAALALAKDAPARPVVPGILTRMLLSWAFGTGVAVLGTSLVAAAFLLGGHDHHELRRQFRREHRWPPTTSALPNTSATGSSRAPRTSRPSLSLSRDTGRRVHERGEGRHGREHTIDRDGLRAEGKWFSHRVSPLRQPP